ncbi:MAG: hypothetical protein H6940_10655 [Burkholderiales bacterium]|uniref:hypothetical protein n=1 Tax=Nitrosomonas sp. TaxID=42353 RepID=UPI001DCA036A|nr:hypothetical protein [Nitrosomonas sp.]MCB1948009.1 hypothetical protein [Nitrosomonas sp.]MCP5243872.1 hypothetical protein [Burkholderiales bacterium]
MSNDIHNVTESVIERFKQELTPEALNCLSASDFDKLGMLIKNTIAKDREDTAAQLESLARQLKADIEYFDISL